MHARPSALPTSLLPRLTRQLRSERPAPLYQPSGPAPALRPASHSPPSWHRKPTYAANAAGNLCCEQWQLNTHNVDGLATWQTCCSNCNLPMPQSTAPLMQRVAHMEMLPQQLAAHAVLVVGQHDGGACNMHHAYVGHLERGVLDPLLGVSQPDSPRLVLVAPQRHDCESSVLYDVRLDRPGLPGEPPRGHPAVLFDVWGYVPKKARLAP
jgi:hypothetical protein